MNNSRLIVLNHIDGPRGVVFDCYTHQASRIQFRGKPSQRTDKVRIFAKSGADHVVWGSRAVLLGCSLRGKRVDSHAYDVYSGPRGKGGERRSLGPEIYLRTYKILDRVRRFTLAEIVVIENNTRDISE